MPKTNYQPSRSHTITPHFTVSDAAGAIDFYKKALGAQEISRMEWGGKIGHAEMKIGDSIFMLADEFPQSSTRSPKTLGGTSCNFHVYVQDVDKAFQRATAAGAQTVMAPADMFWGDRYSQVLDPYGHCWALATHIEDVAPEEMERRRQAAFGGMSHGA